jgi:hypothetical protein
MGGYVGPTETFIENFPAKWYGSTSISGGVIIDGLVLALDAGVSRSYPGSGTAWTDLSGNGNNGTLVNGVGYSGSNLGSLVFDGSNDNVSVNLSSLIYCIDFWIKPTTSLTYLTTDNFIMDFNNGQQSIAFGSCTGLVSNELITVLTNSNPAIGARSSYVSTTDSISGWTNIVCNWNGSDYIFTVNGSTKQTTSGGSTREIISSVSPIKIGLSDGDGITGTFSGNISNIKLYNRALTAQEIQQNFNATRSRFGL